MRKRILALMLMATLLTALLPAAYAQDVYDGLGRAEEQQTSAACGEITVESLLAACKEPTLEKKTELMHALHDYFVSEMTCAAKAQELENAQKALTACQADALMGLGDAAALDAAQKAADRAQAESDKAALEQQKVISTIRGLTDVDVSGTSLSAQDAFLTLKPSDLTLGELKEAASVNLAPDADAEQALLGLEQNYIDMSLTYAEIGLAASDYRTAVETRESLALSVVMGKATAEEFRVATANMKQARLSLFSAMSEYSKLLYTVNETCGGWVVEKAGKLTGFMTN